MIRKIQYSKFKVQFSREAGVTLLLAVLIMSGLTLIATTLAFLGLNQIRASRAALVTEPAFLAAKIGGEEALWQAKRAENLSSVPDCLTGSNSQSISASGSYNSYCKEFEGGTFSLSPGNSQTILLYDPDDPNGNIDLLSMNPRYSSIGITHRSGVQTTISVTRLDGSASGISPSSCNVNGGASLTCPITINPVGSPGEEGRILITLTAASGSASVDVNTNRGLPTNLNIVSNACSARNVTLSNCNTANQETYNRKVEIKFK